METIELYLKTIFCIMACDGNIAEEEIEFTKKLSKTLKSIKDIDVEKFMNDCVARINKNGVLFLREYLKELKQQELSEREQLQIVDLAIQTIFADCKTEYSEVKFFKKIRSRLTLTDEQILAIHPEIDDLLLPDINVLEDPKWGNVMFDNISLAEQ